MIFHIHEHFSLHTHFPTLLTQTQIGTLDSDVTSSMTYTTTPQWLSLGTTDTHKHTNTSGVDAVVSWAPWITPRKYVWTRVQILGKPLPGITFSLLYDLHVILNTYAVRFTEEFYCFVDRCVWVTVKNFGSWKIASSCPFLFHSKNNSRQVWKDTRALKNTHDVAK